MRRYYKKSGRAYWKYAGVLLEDGLLEESAVCYMNAARAYKNGGRYRKAKKGYRRAAIACYKLAEMYYSEQRAQQSGEYHRKAAIFFEQAGKNNEAQEAWKKTVISYYNIASRLYGGRDYQSAHECCQSALNAARRIKGRFTPGDESRKLLHQIETAMKERGND